MNDATRDQPIRLLLATALVVLSTLSAWPAYAQVFRCTDADGHTVFSDTQCGTNSQRVDVVESSGGLSPIAGDGLSAAEKGQLGAAEARAAQIVNEQAQGGARQPSGAASSSLPPPPPPRSGY
jgi:hypothetical protein